MNPITRATAPGLALLALLLPGCATIISGRDVEVPINSTPSAAQVSVRNDQGEVVAQAQTPARVTLKRGRGFLRRPPHYTATIEKPGYQPASVAIDPRLNPWVAGNIALGGVVGLVADSATGAMWRLTPDVVNTTLSPAGAPVAATQASPGVVQTGHQAPVGEGQ